ncbi:MarR family winged helix-turn-helix transcriptional regulator [uncultured Jatrophihabitans sp.]|uniref:MarR family winged helix-turn-helix transcriptional regulator n=1 Tax=uncultured Jatrophihabitans sp. TaxID=1610747 RepID=UPI0035C96174
MDPEPFVGEPGDAADIPGAAAAPDEVDDIVAAWRRERADLDIAPLEVMSRLDRLAGVLGERRAAIFAQHDLRRHEFDVLAALRRAGEPFEMRAGALALATYVTSGTMTSRLDGLTERGLVTRAADQDDGRLVRVALTPDGRERVDAAFEALLGAERELLAPLALGSLGPLADSLRALLAQASATAPQPGAGPGAPRR